MVIRHRWTFAELLVAAACVVLLFAWFTAMGWFGLSNWPAWFTAGVLVAVASALPWGSTP